MPKDDRDYVIDGLITSIGYAIDNLRLRGKPGCTCLTDKELVKYLRYIISKKGIKEGIKTYKDIEGNMEKLVKKDLDLIKNTLVRDLPLLINHKWKTGTGVDAYNKALKKGV